jgi:hypothetical protein
MASPKGYEKIGKNNRHVWMHQDEDNPRKVTIVSVTKAGEGMWLVRASKKTVSNMDMLKSFVPLMKLRPDRTIGIARTNTKADGRKRAVSWMESHPKGL